MPIIKLSEEHWGKLKPIMLDSGVYDKPNLRSTIEAILYRLKVGCPWRYLPEQYGKWNSIYKRFNEWSKQEKIMSIFKKIIVDPDCEWFFIDGSVVKAHQHATGARKGSETAIGKSVGGNTTKIHLVVDGHGNPFKFSITGGNVHDSVEAIPLIEKLPHSNIVSGDKAYGGNNIREAIEKNGARPVIPRKSNSKIGNDDMDWCLYKYRHLVENAFARLKHFRSIATRYDKLKRNYESVVALGCIVMWLPL